jgi:putative endonuclease
MEHVYAGYIMSNVFRGVMYTGITSNLPNRATQHREGLLEGFTKKYQLKKLVFYQLFGDVTEAITFEKRLKRWRREWKFELIERTNPAWDDLYPALMGWDITGQLSHLQGR